MSLTNEQYDTIMRIYSRRQADNRFRQKERQQVLQLELYLDQLEQLSVVLLAVLLDIWQVLK